MVISSSEAARSSSAGTTTMGTHDRLKPVALGREGALTPTRGYT
jgi:hypothetical protein